jgi:ABC-type sugar transport system ATPase subunit
MLAGLEEVSDGRILIGSRVVNNLAPGARDVAMVFQSYALCQHMTVYDNLAFGLRNKNFPKREIDERVRRAAEILGLEALLKRKPKQLSGGQRQRVALGRAIVREPEAFLMDEPLSNLDAQLRVATRAEILKLQRNLETTTIYVTHDQVEAMTMGDRIAGCSARSCTSSTPRPAAVAPATSAVRASRRPGRRRRRRRRARAGSLPGGPSRGRSRSAARGTWSSPSVRPSSATARTPR